MAGLNPDGMDEIKVRILQTEYPRNNAYRPDASKVGFPILDLTNAQEQALMPGFSDHGTEVAQIIIAGEAAGLIESPLMVMEAVAWMYPNIADKAYSLNAGRTTPPYPAKWHLINCSWGGTDQLWENDILTKAALQNERDNVLGICSVADAGMGVMRLLGSINSPNWVIVGSSTTGSVFAPGQVIQLWEPIDWNSFAEPTCLEVFTAAVHWCLNNAPNYKASDIKRLAISTANVHSDGRAFPNYGALMLALHDLYTVTLPPVQPNPIEPIPVPVTPPPTPVPPIIAMSTAKINSFTHSAGWAPSRLTFSVSGAVSLTLTDPTGATIPLPVTTTFLDLTSNDASGDFILSATGTDGLVVQARTNLHAAFTAAQKAAGATPIPVVPGPTVDQVCAGIASTLGIAYNATTKTFSGLSTSQTHALNSALLLAGL